MVKVNNKEIAAISIGVAMVTLLSALNTFCTFTICFYYFENVTDCWVLYRSIPQ